MRTSGRLDDPSPVKPEMQDEGQPESYIRGAAGGERPGQLGTLPKPAPPKACDVRGNSNGHRRHSRRTEAKGQPEDSDAGSAERERGRGNLETQPRRSAPLKPRTRRRVGFAEEPLIRCLITINWPEQVQEQDTLLPIVCGAGSELEAPSWCLTERCLRFVKPLRANA